MVELNLILRHFYSKKDILLRCDVDDHNIFYITAGRIWEIQRWLNWELKIQFNSIQSFLFQIHQTYTFWIPVYILEWSFCFFTKPEQQLRKFNRRSYMNYFIYYFRSNFFTGNWEITKLLLVLNTRLCSSVESSVQSVSISMEYEVELRGSHQNIWSLPARINSSLNQFILGKIAVYFKVAKTGCNCLM